MTRKNFTKKELIHNVAEATGLKKKDVAAVIDATFAEVGSAVVAGDLVRMSGLGTLGMVHKEARKGHNPRTGETMTIPAHNTVKFKASKDVKARI